MSEPKEGTIENSDDRKRKLATQLQAKQHAAMTGAGYSIEYGLVKTNDKHTRNGIDAAHVSHAGLVQLLIKKGIITEEEYLESMLEAWDTEVKRYEKELSDHLGRDVKLA